MKREFKIQKIELDRLLNLLMELYESGIDYVDLSSDNSVPGQDKLLIHTRDEYVNPEYKEKFGGSRELSREDVTDEDYEDEKEDDCNDKLSPLSDEDINGLI
jgi:hypothetical protein